MLSVDQLVQLAASAGFSGADLATAVSIALAESGGNPTAYNPERAAGAAQGKGSYGLWQIYITMHPEFSAERLIDPAYNAAAAYAVYQQAGNSFRPWSTFKNGMYLAHLDVVNAAIGAASGSQDQEAANGGDGGGFTPDGTQTILMFAVGAGVLWWLLQRV